jgi:gamma-glutamyltranspeptidase/glutathione hydrolase
MNKFMACRVRFLSVLYGSALLGMLSACAVAPSVGVPATTSGGDGRAIASQPARQAAATAHPMATRAALTMLTRGGSPIDAAIAAQMVLGLVEPQSSGLGGGSLIMLWDQASGKLTSFDGLASAPGTVTPGLHVDVDGRALKGADVDRGGRSVGVPGTLAVLWQVHQRFGKLPWASLFQPAIELSDKGFAMPPYLHGVLSSATAAADHPDMRELYFAPDGKALPVGALVRNPVYAATLRRIAQTGSAEIATGDAGRALLASVGWGAHPSLLVPADLAAYQPRERAPLCSPFLAYTVCVMAPPSFGGVVVLQVLQMVQARASRGEGAATFSFDDPAFVHFFAEAGRLAQADRQKYVGDPDFIRVPLTPLVAEPYLRARASLIDPDHAAPTQQAGQVDERSPAQVSVAEPLSESSDATSQLAIVDRDGNALSMTTTINLNFGSRLMAGGFVLNNAMTNFSAPPKAGQVAPNRMQPAKRPVTSMAPTIVFDRSGQPFVVGGSAGGGQIVDYISESLLEMLANGRTPAQALARGHVSTALRGKLQLEAGTPAAAQAAALAARGHDVAVTPMPSGLGFLMRREGGWIGAADPRRDGVALGD